MSKQTDEIFHSLNNMAITFDELGFEPTTANDKNYEHFNEWFSFEIYKIELNTNEQENQIKQLKQQLTKKSQQIKKSKQTIKEKNSFGLALFATLYELLEETDPENVSSRISFCTRQKKSLYDDTYKTIRNLQHRLEEKDKEIKSLIVDYEKRISQEQELMSNMEHRLAEKQNTIDEINKEFVQSVKDLKTLCAEKDKEIESLHETISNKVTSAYGADLMAKSIQFFLEKENHELKQNQTQLAIHELEKVKNKCNGMYELWLDSNYKENMYNNEDIAGVFEDISVFTNDLIKKLKGE